MKPLHTFAVLLALATSPLEAGGRIAVYVSPRIAFAPATIVIRTTIAKNADNRAMELEIDGEEYYRSSLVQLEGEDARRTISIELRNLPGGIYHVRATLVHGELLNS